MQANIIVQFNNGIGHVNVTLIRDKAIVSKGNLRRSGTITLNDVESSDTVSIDGACAGTTHLDIDVNIDPSPSTRDYDSGDIFDDFDIV